MTKQQLKKFIATRNKSLYSTNLQFQIDAEVCGFRVSELGQAKKLPDYSYEWQTPHGTLREYCGKLSLS